MLLAIVAVAALAITLFGAPLAVAVRRLERARALLYLGREAVPVADHAERAPTLRLPAGSLAPRRARIGLYDEGGRRIDGEGPQAGDPIVLAAIRSGRVVDGASGDQLLVAAPVVTDGRVRGAVRAEEATDVADDRTVAIWAAMGGLGGAVVLAALGMARWQARRITRPLVGLADAATRLGGGDFTIRTARSGMRELDQLADALDATASRLDELLVRERAFSADASHQLRTHLTGLRLVLEEAMADGPQREDALRTATEVVDHLETTVVDLLALARDTADRKLLLQLDVLVEELTAAWQPRLAAAGRHLVVAVDADLPPVRASAAAVRQILDVLVANAFEHGAGAVTLSARSSGTGLSLDVADEGSTTIADREAIFARRPSAPPVDGGAASRGIGLSLARSLASAEGGRLFLRHQGPGPCFSLLLPATAPP